MTAPEYAMDEWYAHVTVATVVEDNGRFLLVEEYDGDRLVFNQPAGHLDPNESLIEGALRETLEETGWTVEIQGIVGVGLYTAPGNGVTYYRTAFHAKPIAHDPSRRLDEGIVRAVWMTPEEIRAEHARMRSPLVPKVIEQYLAGHRYPLSMIFG
jgi:8-oxo-dGTP pyrophosphatase MutT (NUDIX family)